jgi:predicted permease
MISPRRRLTYWLQRRQREGELREELQFHLDQEALERHEAGLSEDDARWAARRDLGNQARLRENIRELWTWRALEELGQDLRYTWRTLFRERSVALFAVLSLTLGIGANTAIFSLMEAALWKPMPVRDPQRLRVFTWTAGPHAAVDSTWDDWDRVRPNLGYNLSASFTYGAFEAFAADGRVFDRVFAFKPVGRVTALVDGQAELVGADLVSGGTYEGLGIVPALGRPIVPSDDQRGRTRTVAVISNGYWTRRFGRDPNVLGRVIQVNQTPVTIVGVNPPGFTGLSSQASPDMFMPLTMQPVVQPYRYTANGNLLDDVDTWWLNVIGRLKPGVTDAEAEAVLQGTLLEVVRKAQPESVNLAQPYLRFFPGARGLDNLAENFGAPLTVLLWFVVVLLLIACANVANLLLARASSRRRELSLRLALGAGRARLARQLLTEGLVLGVCGGGFGVLLAYGIRDIVPGLLLPSWTPAHFEAVFDGRVLTLALAVTLATSVLFSLLPVWQAVRGDVHAALKDGGRTVVNAAYPLRGRALIVFQISLSVVLLVAAALFLRTLANLRSVGLGFRPERIVLFTIDPPRAKYMKRARTSVFEEIDRQIAGIPGIESSSLSEVVLVSGGDARTTITLAGTTPEKRVETWVNTVGYRFFDTMEIPIVVGRSYNASDGRSSAKVAIVNQEFVRTYVSGNPIGQRFRSGSGTYEIVGVCGDTQFNRARAPIRPIWFDLLPQADDIGAMTFAVKTSTSLSTILPAIREAVRTVDNDLAIYDLHTQQQQIDSTMAYERLFVTLTSAFGVLALILASVGIYGLLAQNVSRRTPEIGIRMALGATAANVLAMVLREASLLAVIGVIIGTAAAGALGRVVQATLFGVTPIDPVAIGGAVSAMLIVALLAGWLPARRACRLNPLLALRHE